MDNRSYIMLLSRIKFLYTNCSEHDYNSSSKQIPGYQHVKNNGLFLCDRMSYNDFLDNIFPKIFPQGILI